MELDTIGHRSAAPSVGVTVAAHARRICAGAEGGSERRCDAALECVARNVPHLFLDLLEALSFALPDLYRKQLQEVPVVVGRRSAGSFGPVEQPVRNVEAH